MSPEELNRLTVPVPPTSVEDNALNQKLNKGKATKKRKAAAGLDPERWLPKRERSVYGMTERPTQGSTATEIVNAAPSQESVLAEKLAQAGVGSKTKKKKKKGKK